MSIQLSGSRTEGLTAASSIADDLAALILGNLKPGASLPSEAELATRYKVSRLTIREALKLLAGRGLLDVGRGRRAIVRQPSGGAFADFLTSIVQSDPKGLFDLLEVRLSLEVQAATLATKRAGRAALVGMEVALQNMRDAETNRLQGADPVAAEQQFHEQDIAFHEALMLAGGNRLMIFLFEAMSASLQEGFRISRRGHELRGHTFGDVIAEHERILQAVSEGNPRKAAEAMRAHLLGTEQDMLAALTVGVDSRSP